MNGFAAKSGSELLEKAQKRFSNRESKEAHLIKDLMVYATVAALQALGIFNSAHVPHDLKKKKKGKETILYKRTHKTTTTTTKSLEK